MAKLIGTVHPKGVSDFSLDVFKEDSGEVSIRGTEPDMWASVEDMIEGLDPNWEYTPL